VTTPGLTPPAITVLMSCFNAARWLDEAVDSVLRQSLKDFEFIIVDDGSSDGTLDMIRRHAERDSRVVVISKPNTGLADSLNAGIQAARGKWIARLDADDTCEPTRLESQLAVATANSNLVFVGSGLTVIDQFGNCGKTYRYPRRHATLANHLRTARRFPPHSSAFYRTASVRAVGGYRPRIRRAQDRDLWLRLAEVGELACLRAPLVRVRKHGGQVSHEDGGKRQVIDSRMAIVSHYLRMHDFEDPVGDHESSFDSFFGWIVLQLENGGFFEYVSFNRHVRALYRGAPNPVAGALQATCALLRQRGLVTRTLRARLLGENMPRRLARDWMSQRCSPS